ncbi:hypothetical protein RHMOL_Rhmol05G0285500 [Rhododendron molle]|uniref:Uncharacterized protein n=1 Tax=Rhododendron molle TaxID=49168 RepID=A0ACC0NUD4_RHOML|nr:hypothetical protein RHMOL_Rhmol05G0285500 [Rhododendron molle]
MDPEQTFIRVQERFSQMLTPRIRATLEYVYLFVAITLFCILVVMHANYVQQPGCSSELTGVETTEAQLIQIKITSAGLWSQNESQYEVIDVSVKESESKNLKVEDGDELTFFATEFWLNWIGSSTKKGKLAMKSWKSDYDIVEPHAEVCTSGESSNPAVDDGVPKINKEESRFRFPISAKESFKAVVFRICRKWDGRLSFCWRHGKRILRGLWDIAGIHLNLDIPKWLRILHLDMLNSYAVQWLEKKSKAFEPTYLYTMEKGYFLLPEGARSRHNIRTVNISISARHSCFGNRWQQLLINRLVGYDTILMNSLLSSPGQGFLYNYQTKEFYNLTYAHEQPESSAKFGDYLVTKCGVLMMSLFVFFTTTMSVSFTLRETQTRMLKFTGFSYLALSTTASFMQHLILYFWNRFEVPALQRFMQNRRSQFQQHPDFHITSSTILASTLHITRLNTRHPVPQNTDMTSGPETRVPDPVIPGNGAALLSGFEGPAQNDNSDSFGGNPLQDAGQADLRQAETGGNPGTMNSFSSLLLWILGGASSEGLNSFLSMFRDVRDQGQVFAENPQPENHMTHNAQ